MNLFIWKDPTRGWLTRPADSEEVRSYGWRRPGIRRLAREYGALITPIDPATGHLPSWFDPYKGR